MDDHDLVLTPMVTTGGPPNFRTSISSRRELFGQAADTLKNLGVAEELPLGQ